MTSDDGPGPVTMSSVQGRCQVRGLVTVLFCVAVGYIFFCANSGMGLSCRGIKEIKVPRKKEL